MGRLYAYDDDEIPYGPAEPACSHHVQTPARVGINGVKILVPFEIIGIQIDIRRGGSLTVKRIPFEPTPEAQSLVRLLETKMDAVLLEIENSEVYRLVAAPETDPRLVARIIKFILLEVFSYGPHVTEATFMAVGRMPKDRPDLMREMILHDVEEANHGEMALKDFIKLGGDEQWARSRRITPESFAMGATCRMLAQMENPFSYLGYMYLFEGLTPVLTERAQGFLAAHGFPIEAQHFIDFHAIEDAEHVDLLSGLIHRVVSEYPDSGSAIEYGFDCFAAVYPLPIWRAALSNAKSEVAGVL